MTDTSRSKPGGAYHHGDLRRALLDAAMDEVERAGAAELSLAKLAKSLGVSQPAPYRHFADRDGLLVEVVTEGFRQFAAMLVAAPGRSRGKAALLRMCQAYIRFGRDRGHLYRAMFASQLLARALDDDALKLAARESFTHLVEAVTATGHAEPASRALEIWVGLHGLVMLANENLMNGALVPIGVEELVERLVG